MTHDPLAPVVELLDGEPEPMSGAMSALGDDPQDPGNEMAATIPAASVTKLTTRADVSLKDAEIMYRYHQGIESDTPTLDPFRLKLKAFSGSPDTARHLLNLCIEFNDGAFYDAVVLDIIELLVPEVGAADLDAASSKGRDLSDLIIWAQSQDLYKP